MIILILNCRGFSIHFQLFDWSTRTILARGDVDRIELGDSFIVMEVPGRDPYHLDSDCSSFGAAVALILSTLTHPLEGPLDRVEQIAAVGHRVAHGGERFTSSVTINEEIIAAVRGFEELAPLHIPANLAGIEGAMATLPRTPHVAVFDSAFHQTMPLHAYIYPLPWEWYEKHGVRRYGFHGAPHCYAAQRGAALLGRDPAACNLVTVHIGNGTSLCAVEGGRSIDTSMGLTPLEGTMMGTRCGSIDPGIPPFMMQEEQLAPRDMDRILNQRSGAAGITGLKLDRAAFLARAAEGNERCLLALEMEAYRLKKHIGGYAAALGRLDAVVFSTASGEGEWLVREKTLADMEIFGIRLDRERNRAARSVEREERISADDSPVAVYVVHTEEEMVYAEEVAALLNGAGG
ncbi:acetate kinase [Geobacter metallireducens RCH3]|uniref:Acetate kinase n=1 Tax=Geobacter metallireducens (strain ATCC 53774 / DSM 7210 / GS-15) TaxID=269799 RepID=Q39ZC6_GEOMG|nr:acetate kinase [Geobacter metallireducens]ABB30398.1 acetate kinase-related protein [Geobacter metallireducens GS-15]EHP87268.1 acetate kinase [Geobacter metallireducens RCH3]